MWIHESLNVPGENYRVQKKKKKEKKKKKNMTNGSNNPRFVLMLAFQFFSSFIQMLLSFPSSHPSW